MPIYEYECAKCCLRFEVKRSFNEDGSCLCPQCGGEALRVFSPVPIIFKGSGFYVTDSRGKNCTLDKVNEGNTEKKPENKKDIKKEA